MPPECFPAKYTSYVTILASPSQSINFRRSENQESLDVWGMGTLVYELATGQTAGEIHSFQCHCKHLCYGNVGNDVLVLLVLHA